MANRSRSGPDAGARFAAVGAGRMGRGIAIAFAYAGHRITLIDLRVRSADAWNTLADEVHAEIEGVLRGLIELEVVREDQLSRIAERIELVPVRDAPGPLAAAEMVFECVPETIQAKQDAFDFVNRHGSETAILTSTTSSLPAARLAGMVDRPERFLNTHWLNPAYVIPLVEVSFHPDTDEQVLKRTRSVLESIGKLPVECGSTIGYIVPRLQTLVMNEAARMVEEGLASVEEIDKATRYGLGLRFAALGVLEFIDFGGCDILHYASKTMEGMDPDRFSAPEIVQDMMKRNTLGLKSEAGFYSYEGRDLSGYRKDVLRRTLGMLQHVDMLHPPVDETIG